MGSMLKPYVGPLTPAETVAGIKAAQGNAERLLSDAKLLLEHKRWPSALALATLAIEEKGKVVILKSLALFSDEKRVKNSWREYRSHRAKNAGWILPELAFKGAKTLRDLALAVDSGGEHTEILDALKQISFYSDCLGNRNWSEPAAVITESLARGIVSVAEITWSLEPVTLREVELWVEKVAPHYETNGMAQAVLDFQLAMYNEGLSPITPDKFKTFIGI